MTTLLKTILEELLLFLPFVLLQNLCGVSGEVGFGVCISDMDVNDTVCSAGP